MIRVFMTLRGMDFYGNSDDAAVALSVLVSEKYYDFLDNEKLEIRAWIENWQN